MRVGGRHYRSIWRSDPDEPLRIIDQTRLPHRFEIVTLDDVDDVAEAISVMRVRGAPLIGATAAHGIVLALQRDPSDAALSAAAAQLRATRPTAVNLGWAIDRVVARVRAVEPARRVEVAFDEASGIAEEDVEACEAIGRAGHSVLTDLAARREAGGRAVSAERPLQILTHCNAGWLATVDWGTALAPIYKAHEAGLPVHVWVDETRPRNQGASLTAFELREMGVPHTVVVDNAGGHLMQRGLVDVVLVGSDRTTASGDVCNKIGTYLKALAAKDNGVPFYATLPVSTIDWSIADGVAEIPIEERDASEVRSVVGLDRHGEPVHVELFSDASPAANPAFDVTPAALVDGVITEWGRYEASEAGLSLLRAQVERGVGRSGLRASGRSDRDVAGDG